MVANKKTLASFPKTTKKSVNLSVKSDVNIKSDVDKICFKEELLDDIDEMNEDQVNLLHDTELLHTIGMTENDIENKLHSSNLKEELVIGDTCNIIKLSKNKKKL